MNYYHQLSLLLVLESLQQQPQAEQEKTEKKSDRSKRKTEAEKKNNVLDLEGKCHKLYIYFQKQKNDKCTELK